MFHFTSTTPVWSAISTISSTGCKLTASRTLPSDRARPTPTRSEVSSSMTGINIRKCPDRICLLCFIVFHSLSMQYATFLTDWLWSNFRILFVLYLYGYPNAKGHICIWHIYSVGRTNRTYKNLEGIYLY